MASEESPVKTIAVTGAGEGEGASTVAVNTALSLALGHEHRVLLVDASLRRPVLRYTDSCFTVPQLCWLA